MSTLQLVARWVRRVTWSTLAASVAIAIALMMFDAGRHSGGDRELTVTPSVRPDLVAQAVADVEARGLSCSATPTLSSSIVFEWLDGRVGVVTFDEALTGARDGEGWVRWYCAEPAA
ncbi:hypothetical protein [Aeromicrobium sp. Leaf350]|uniref:hypothetical protein n=1 Tax=Aeromicrobium sp. Leaf350 TaxID=2876565 RepID=UPI001E5188B0|nr:hypothetical protein [Aeromicrobium sp. Leaf350]